MRLALTTSAQIPGGGQKASGEAAAKGLGGQKVSSRAFFGVLAIGFASAHLVDCRVCGIGAGGGDRAGQGDTECATQGPKELNWPE